MGGQSSKIDTSKVKIEQIKATTPIQQGRFCPPFRKFNNQNIKIDGKKMQALLQVQEPSREKISMTQQFYQDLQDAFQNRTKQIQLQTVLTDEHYTDLRTFNGTQKGKDVTLQLKPFSNPNSFHFNNILYQIHMNEEISKLNCRNLNTIIDKYAIQTGLQVEGEEYPNTEVFVLSPITTNLSEMIRYRRQNKWPWTTNQFNALATDLANAVKALHSANISHNDIRPCNVYYSLQQNCYQLSSFGNAVRSLPGSLTASANHLRTSVHFGAPELSTAKEVDFQQADIYSLGMTLLCAFYLCQPIDRNAVVEYNKKYESSYSIMSAIREMIMPIDKRSGMDTIIQRIPKGSNSTNMRNLISSLKYKSTPKDTRLISAKKMLSDGYQRLGLWNQWKNLNFQAYELQLNSIDEFKKANSLHQLAKIESCRGDNQSADQYSKLASKIYRGLGYGAYEHGNINESINLFSKATQCTKYFDNKYDMEIAKNLQGLALAHSEKGEYQLAKPLINESNSIVVRNSGKNSLDYCKVKMSEAKIETEFGQFQNAEKILQQCLGIANEKIKIDEKIGLQLKAQILHELGSCTMKRSDFQPESKVDMLSKSERTIAEAISLNQQFPDNHLAIAHNIQKMGEIELRKQNYNDAKNNFNKAMEIRNQYIQVKPQISLDKEHAQNLCNVAACESGLNNHSEALKNYNLALQKYRKMYGSDHNKLSAMTIGNMSKVYYKLNDKEKAKDCLNVAIQIIEEISGKEDPDLIHFKQLSQTL